MYTPRRVLPESLQPYPLKTINIIASERKGADFDTDAEGLSDYEGVIISERLGRKQTPALKGRKIRFK